VGTVCFGLGLGRGLDSLVLINGFLFGYIGIRCFRLRHGLGFLILIDGFGVEGIEGAKSFLSRFDDGFLDGLQLLESFTDLCSNLLGLRP
jgi:hypothetical protein